MNHILLPMLPIFLVACGQQAGSDDHGGHGGHGGHDDHGEETPTIAVTRWTDTHELFVEFDVPAAGEPFSYHAHVTRLADNHAASSGTFTVRFTKDGVEASSFVDEGVARSGIFVDDAPAPATPGPYEVVFSYADSSESAEWSVGTVQVGKEPIPADPAPEGEIGFLKETQWVIPFLTDLPRPRIVQREVAAAGEVKADPRFEAVIASPTTGVVLWSRPEGPPVAGALVQKGEVLGHVVGAASAENWTAVQMDAESARLVESRARSELARLETLGKDGLVPDLRVAEARAALAQAEASLTAAARREQMLAGNHGQSVPIRASSSGVVTEVALRHGDAVAPGQKLLRIAATSSLVLETRLPVKDLRSAEEVRWTVLERPATKDRWNLADLGAELLSTGTVVDFSTQTVPLAWRIAGPTDLRPGEQVDLRLGLGSGSEVLSVPRTAIVEVNTRPYVFVMVGGESFTRRPVRLGDAGPDHVAILDGLKPEERVVTVGGFDVYVASLGGALESHRH